MTDELEGKLVSSNKEHEVDLEYKPADLNKNGQKVEIELESKCQPAARTWSADLELKAGGFDLGPIVPWTTVSNHVSALNYSCHNIPEFIGSFSKLIFNTIAES